MGGATGVHARWLIEDGYRVHLIDPVPEHVAQAATIPGITATLGDANRHGCRAKFFQQYRLFFRYHAQARIIVFAWVNDDDTRCVYDSAGDAYRAFRRMLDSRRPPSDWDALLAEARAESERLGRLVAGHF